MIPTDEQSGVGIPPAPQGHPAILRQALRHRDTPCAVIHEQHREPQRRFRRAIKARGHFPNDNAALKCLYLVTRSLDPTGRGRARWMMRWKPAINAFSITFGDRFPAAETY